MVEQLRGNLIDILTATACLGDQPGGEVVRQVHGNGHYLRVRADEARVDELWTAFARADHDMGVLIRKALRLCLES